MTLDLIRATSEDDIATCMALRWEVFVTEQGVSEEDELDGQDAGCTHILARLDGQPIGAARYQILDGYAKLQRVCVRHTGRGHGVGAALINFMLDEIRTQTSVKEVRLGAQTHALSFYRNLGFAEFGAEYDDAGIPHMDMSLTL